MKKVLKFIFSNILAFILGAVIFGGIGIALAVTGISSTTLGYTNDKNPDVVNVEDALNYLYSKAPKGLGTGMGSSFAYNFNIMLQTKENSDDYKLVSISELNNGTYIYNLKKSYCDDNHKLVNNSDGSLTIEKNSSNISCYLYYDIVTRLSDYIIKTLYTTDGENGLYYHDGKGSYTNASEEAGDKSYRFAGSNNVVKNNYVCFGAELDENGNCDSSNLYRIIGVFNKNFEDSSATPEYQVKLIKSTVANATQLGTGTGTYAWDSSNKNTWSTASLKELLNNYYINTYLDKTNNSKWSRMIDLDHTWKVGGNDFYGKIGDQTVKTAYTNEILEPVTTNSSDNKIEDTFAIGLMYVSDYMYAVAPSGWKTVGYDSSASQDYRGLTTNNWLYTTNYPGSAEWLLSRSADSATYAFSVFASGRVDYRYVNDAFGVRPSFYLDSSVLYGGGKGTKDEPWILSI